MIEQRNYYFLIAGLPEIVLEQSKAPFSLSELVEELRANLHSDDFALVELILLANDNQNFLSLLQKKAAPWRTPCCFTEASLEAGLKQPETLPFYLQQFYEDFKNQTPLLPGMSWENQLAARYYDYALARTEEFLHQWFTFEQQLRNVLARWNVRQFKLPVVQPLVGQNDVTEMLERSQSRDFGLAKDLPFVEKLLTALERGNLLEREKAIDRIRWNYLDELRTFHYFSVEVVLAYLLQFMILQRWLRFNAEQGVRLITEKIQELENKVDLNAVQP